MRRLLALLALLLASGSVEAQTYPWTKTKTPTPRPTLAVPTPTATVFVPQYTPVPTPRPGSTISFQLSTFVTGVDVAGFDPIRYEVQINGAWYVIVPGPSNRIWTLADRPGVGLALGLNPFLRVTGRDGSVHQGPLHLSQPHVLLAQSAGPVNLISFTTPQ